MENSEYSIFDLSDPEVVSIQVFGSNFTGRALYGTSPLHHVEVYTEYSGRMAALPSWALEGPVVGYEGGTAKVASLYKKLIHAGIRPAAFWLQDWTGLREDTFGARLWWNWELDEDHYHDWESLAHNLSATGTKLLTYINPYVANTVTKDKPNFRRDLFKEGAALGYLVKDEKGAPYVLASGSTSFTFGTVDLSNPAAVAWYSMRGFVFDTSSSVCHFPPRLPDQLYRPHSLAVAMGGQYDDAS